MCVAETTYLHFEAQLGQIVDDRTLPRRRTPRPPLVIGAVTAAACGWEGKEWRADLSLTGALVIGAVTAAACGGEGKEERAESTPTDTLMRGSPAGGGFENKGGGVNPHGRGLYRRGDTANGGASIAVIG